VQQNKKMKDCINVYKVIPLFIGLSYNIKYQASPKYVANQTTNRLSTCI